MSDDQLPAEVDVVVLGTGLPEAILAAACSRAGLSVLHLDRNDFYGGLWSSFNLKTIEDWKAANSNAPVTENGPVAVDVSSLLKTGEQYVKAAHHRTVENISLESSLRSAELSGEDSGTVEWRKYSLDLLPKSLLSRGDMVKLLCDSGVARYCEFKCLDRFLSFAGDNDLRLEVVPCSRSDIFQCETISVLEKRHVMRFLQNCIEWRKNRDSIEGWQQYAERPFDEYLESCDITGKLKYFVRDTLGILKPNANTVEGLDAICKFLGSAGCYGDSPFLWTLYGSGELPQCFCRLCAVFGGTYCLHREINGFVLFEGRVEAVITQGQRINCKQVITDCSYLPLNIDVAKSEKMVHRAVLITDNSLVRDFEKEHISAANLAALRADICPRLIEVGYEGCTAPKEHFVVHLTACGSGGSKATLGPLVDRLCRPQKEIGPDDRRPRQLFSLYFDIQSYAVERAALPQNLQVVPAPDADFCYATVLEKVRSVFTTVWPEIDFLPPSLPTDEQEEQIEVDEPQVEVDGQQINDGEPMEVNGGSCPEIEQHYTEASRAER